MLPLSTEESIGSCRLFVKEQLREKTVNNNNSNGDTVTDPVDDGGGGNADDDSAENDADLVDSAGKRCSGPLIGLIHSTVQITTATMVDKRSTATANDEQRKVSELLHGRRPRNCILRRIPLKLQLRKVFRSKPDDPTITEREARIVHQL